MHPKLEKALLKLTEFQRECGQLPPGFLYCGCECEPYEGVIRFFGWDPNGVSGVCDGCGKVYYVTRNGDFLFVDAETAAGRRVGNFPRTTYTFKYNAPEHFEHVCSKAVEVFWKS